MQKFNLELEKLIDNLESDQLSIDHALYEYNLLCGEFESFNDDRDKFPYDEIRKLFTRMDFMKKLDQRLVVLKSEHETLLNQFILYS